MANSSYCTGRIYSPLLLNRHLGQRCGILPFVPLLNPELEIVQEGERPPAGCGVAIVDESTTAYLDLRGVLDPAKEVEKLRKKQAEVSYTRTRHYALHCTVLHCITIAQCYTPDCLKCSGWIPG